MRLLKANNLKANCLSQVDESSLRKEYELAMIQKLSEVRQENVKALQSLQ
jgi:hypothetical protein